MPSTILDQIRDAFNDANGTVRLISFLSPTCGLCRYGQGVIRSLFDEFPDKNLAGFIVWVPMLPTDSAVAATTEEEGLTDPRITCWFDADRAAADGWSSFIGLPTTTWDVYAVYDEAAVWPNEAPPSPHIWMHQLNATPATKAEDRLDPAKLARDWLGIIGEDGRQHAQLARKLHARGQAVSERADSAPSGLVPDG